MKKFIKRSFEDKRVRFLFVGVLNTIFGYAVYAKLH
jgi:putative flippase GtrA